MSDHLVVECFRRLAQDIKGKILLSSMSESTAALVAKAHEAGHRA